MRWNKHAFVCMTLAVVGCLSAEQKQERQDASEEVLEAGRTLAELREARDEAEAEGAPPETIATLDRQVADAEARYQASLERLEEVNDNIAREQAEGIGGWISRVATSAQDAAPSIVSVLAIAMGLARRVF